MKTAVFYSSKTGNTQMLAEAIAEALHLEAEAIQSDTDPNEYSHLIVGFWLDKGMPDAKALKFLEKIHGKKVGLFFTLGAYPDSEHAEAALTKSKEMMQAQGNEVFAGFKCQGKIDPELLKRFETLPKDHPHYPSPESRARQAEAAKHPNQDDLQAAASCFKKAMQDLASNA